MNFAETIRRRELPPIAPKVTRKQKAIHEEKWLIKCLPANIPRVKKPSIILQNYLKQKEKRHEQTLQWMLEQKASVNNQTDNFIKEKSEGFKNELNRIEKEIDDIINNEPDVSKEIIFANTNYEKAVTMILELHDKRKQKIRSFKADLIQLEKNRSIAFKEILRAAYGNLIQIAHKMPSEIEQYFEKEIILINEITLSNIRTYKDLICELKMRCEYHLRHSHMVLRLYRDKLNAKIKNYIITEFNERQMKEVPSHSPLLIEKEEAQEAYKKFTFQDTKLNILWRNLNPLYLRTKDLEVYSREIDKTVNKLDACAGDLLKMYKIAHSKVYAGYFEGISDMAEHLLSAGVADSQDIEAIEKEFCLPLIENITKQYDMELSDMQHLWANVIHDLQAKLKVTMGFLLESAKLWDGHFERLENAKQLILKDLSVTIQKNDRIAQNAETKLNVYLDMVRQAVDEDIDEPMARIYNMLDDLRTMYHQHHESEVAVVMKFKEYNDMASEFIIAELKRFLHFNPKNESISPTRLRFLGGSMMSLGSKEDIRAEVIPKQIQMCQYHAEAVQNWMFGLWEVIENCMATTTTEMSSKCDEWIKENVTRLTKRLEVKLAIHQPRYETIKEDCYLLRKARLEVLKNRVERHTAGIQSVFDKCVEMIKNAEAECQSNLVQYNNAAAKHIEAITFARNQTNLKNSLTEHEEKYVNSIKNLENIIERCHENLEEKFIVLKMSQLKFLKRIKFFFQPGNCHNKEGMNLMATLKKLDKDIEKKFKTYRKQIGDLNGKYNHFSVVKKDDVEDCAKKTLEEFVFNETAVNKIKSLQNNIKRQVYDIKFKLKKSEAYVKDVMEKSTKRMGDIEFVEDFEKMCLDSVEAIMEARDILIIPDKLLGVSNKILREQTKPDEPNKPAESVKSKTEGDIQDYTPLLFEVKPEPNDKTYIGKSYRALYDSFQEIQKQAKDFYGARENVMDDRRVQPTFQDFMGEVLGKYLLYHVQVDTCWANETAEFLQLVSGFREFVHKLKGDFIHTFKVRAIEKFENNLKQIKKEKTNTVLELKNEYNKVHRQLRPNLGHPLNQELYNAAKDNLNEFLKICCEAFKTSLQPYKEFAIAEYEKYLENLPMLEEKLNEIENKVFDECLTSIIEEQSLKKIAYLERLKSNVTIASTSKLSTVKTNATARLQNFSPSIRTPTDYTCKSVTSILTDTSAETKTAVPSVDVHQLYQSTMDTIEEMVSLNADHCKKWEDLWNSDMLYLKKLFRLKYDAP